MAIKLNLQQFAPKHTYERHGAACYLDPFRQMLMPCTEESLLLLKMEMFVHRVMGVPRNMMYMQQSLRKYGIDASVAIDIIVHDKINDELRPVAMIECRPAGRELTPMSTVHLEDFAKQLGVNCLMLTNGDEVSAFISREDRKSYWQVDRIPSYEGICKAYREAYEIRKAAEKEAEIAAAALLAAAPAVPVAGRNGASKRETVKTPKVPQIPKFKSEATPSELRPFIASFSKWLKDSKGRIESGVYGNLELVCDCGLRRKLLGFGSEKVDKTIQRVLLVKDFYGSHQLTSLDISPDLAGAPILSATLDDGDNRPVALSLDLSKLLILEKGKAVLTYDLRKAFPRENIDFVKAFNKALGERMPDLIRRDKGLVVLGTVALDAQGELEHDKAARLVAQILSLALVIDEFRENIDFVKAFNKTLGERMPDLIRREKGQVVLGTVAIDAEGELEHDKAARLVAQILSLALVIDEFRENLKASARKTRKTSKI